MTSRADDNPEPRVTITTTGTATGPATTTAGTAVRITVHGDDVPRQPGDDMPDRLTLAEAARLIGRTPGVLRRWIASGFLPAEQAWVLNRPVWYVRPSDLAAVRERPTRKGWTDENRAKRAERRAVRHEPPGQLTVAGWIAHPGKGDDK